MIFRGGIAGRAALTGDHSSAAPRYRQGRLARRRAAPGRVPRRPGADPGPDLRAHGLTKGAFYHHFGSVPKFRMALLDRYEQACITVGALLIAAAYGVLAVAGTAPRFGPEGMYRLGVWALAALLLARGVAGPLFSRRGDREFRFWNLAAYSPLCLALGPGALIAHR